MRDILAGIHEAVVRRLVTLVQRLGLEAPVLFSGGVAKNAGLVRRVKDRLGIELVTRTIDPQVIGALGAALLAQKAAGMVHSQLRSLGGRPFSILLRK